MRFRILAQQQCQYDYHRNTDSQLLDLDDHCLRRICSYLKLTDLCSIADTCTQLNNIAGTVFQRNSHFRQFCSSTYNHRTMPTDSMICQLFPIFGKFITEMKIDWKHMGCSNRLKQDFYFRMIDCYCPNLVSLSWPILYFPFPHFFENLHCVRNLKIACHNQAAALNRMYKCVRNVEHLTLHRGTMDKRFYIQLTKLTKLRTLHLINMNDQPDLLELQQVKQISELKIRKHMAIKKGDVCDLVRALPNLSKLIFERTNLFIDEETYLEIVDIRRQMGTKKLILHNMESLYNAI